MVHEEVLSLAAQDRLVNLLGKDLPQGLKTFPHPLPPKIYKCAILAGQDQ